MNNNRKFAFLLMMIVSISLTLGISVWFLCNHLSETAVTVCLVQCCLLFTAIMSTLCPQSCNRGFSLIKTNDGIRFGKRQSLLPDPFQIRYITYGPAMLLFTLGYGLAMVLITFHQPLALRIILIILACAAAIAGSALVGFGELKIKKYHND